jgi:hypothetical protein
MSDAASKVAGEMGDYAKQLRAAEKKRQQERKAQEQANEDALRKSIRIQQDEANRMNDEYQSDNMGRMTDSQFYRYRFEKYGF